MNTSKTGLNIIQKHEGFSAKPYRCPAKVWTIGCGTTVIDGKPVTKETPVITKEQAYELLQKDVATFEAAIRNNVKVPLTQNQFDSLVSFVYNVGIKAFKDSTLLRVLNQGRYDLVPVQMLRWNKAGGKELAGLTNRRIDEGNLFSRA